jgi:hypothetical protein
MGPPDLLQRPRWSGRQRCLIQFRPESSTSARAHRIVAARDIDKIVSITDLSAGSPRRLQAHDRNEGTRRR